MKRSSFLRSLAAIPLAPISLLKTLAKPRDPKFADTEVIDHKTIIFEYDGRTHILDYDQFTQDMEFYEFKIGNDPENHERIRRYP